MEKDDYLKKFFWQAGQKKEMVQRVVVKGYDPKLSISIIECRSALDGYEVAKDYIFGHGEYMAPHLDGRVELTIVFWIPAIGANCQLEFTITFIADPNCNPIERYLVPIKIECGRQDSDVRFFKQAREIEKMGWAWDFFYEEIVNIAKIHPRGGN